MTRALRPLAVALSALLGLAAPVAAQAPTDTAIAIGVTGPIA